MMRSPAHRNLFIGDMEWLVVPPVNLHQFRVYRTEDTVFGYASWAYLNDEAEQRLLKGQRRLSFADWRGGDKLWLIDVVTPFGGPEAVIKDLSETIFPDKEFKALVPGNGKDKEKGGMRVVTFKGKALQEQEAAE